MTQLTHQSPLLHMQDIQISFGGVPALRQARLSVAAGEVHALIGQNGAGKSTLIKILTGAYQRAGGTVQFDGREVDFRTPKAAREAGISTIYQEINLVPYRSVAENIFLGREPRRFGLVDWRTVHRRAQELLESFGLEVDVKSAVGRHSTAIQQMVALARAVSSEAKMVIMDESTSSLDEREVELLFSVVRRLRDDGRAVIFVSHRLDELYALCDRVTVMRDGQTVAESELATFDKLQLVTTMLGRTLAEAPLTNANLRRCDLSGSDLSKAELHGADLRHAELIGCQMVEANLAVARMRHAHLRGCTLDRANLQGADLAGADLAGSNFEGADLKGANMLGVSLNGADLSGAKGMTQAQLESVTGDAKTKLPPGLRLPVAA